LIHAQQRRSLKTPTVSAPPALGPFPCAPISKCPCTGTNGYLKVLIVAQAAASDDAGQFWNMIQGEKTMTLVRGRAGGGGDAGVLS